MARPCAANGRLRVGICWAGSAVHLNDRNRSIALDRFATLLTVPGLDFVSVQKETSEAERAASARQRCRSARTGMRRTLPIRRPCSRCWICSSASTPRSRIWPAPWAKPWRCCCRSRSDFRWLARSHRQPLVPDHASLPSAGHRRLGHAAASLAAGVECGRGEDRGNPRPVSSRNWLDVSRHPEVACH